MREVVTIETPGLGDRSYLIHDGETAVVIDPQRDIDIMRYCWGSRVDPLLLPGEPRYISRALIDACRPYERLADFPAVAEASADLLRRAVQRWPDLAE